MILEEKNVRSDRDIMEELEDKIMKNDDYSTDNVHIEVKNGKVIITGAVESLEVSRDIEDMVNNTPGVVITVNELETRYSD